MEFQDSRIDSSRIQDHLSPLATSLRELANQIATPEIQETAQRIGQRISSITAEPVYDHELAHRLRTVAREVRQSPIGELLSEQTLGASELGISLYRQIADVEKHASEYQNRAAMGKGI